MGPAEEKRLATLLAWKRDTARHSLTNLMVGITGLIVIALAILLMLNLNAGIITVEEAALVLLVGFVVAVPCRAAYNLERSLLFTLEVLEKERRQ